jgi:hypothetical protein
MPEDVETREAKHGKRMIEVRVRFIDVYAVSDDGQVERLAE